MATKNRRVATYLPDNLVKAFDDFKNQRGLGDSQALITILSEFLGVSQKVTHYPFIADPELIGRIGLLESKVAHLEAELLSELNCGLLNLESIIDRKLALLASKQFENGRQENKSEIHSEVATKNQASISPGQLPLLVEEAPTNLKVSESQRADLESMSGKGLSRRLKVSSGTLSGARDRNRDYPEKFAEWSKQKDPDGLAWCYDWQAKLYHAVAQDASTESAERGIPD